VRANDLAEQHLAGFDTLDHDVVDQDFMKRIGRAK
jgi:hypothetical protein